MLEMAECAEVSHLHPRATGGDTWLEGALQAGTILPVQALEAADAMKN